MTARLTIADLAAQSAADTSYLAGFHKRPRDAARIALRAAAMLATGLDRALLLAVDAMIAADAEDVRDAAQAFSDAAYDSEEDHMMRAVMLPGWPRSAEFHPDQRG